MVITDDQWWAELRFARERGMVTSEWPKRCPFTGQEIDEDGSDSCPDNCKHHDSGEFTSNYQEDSPSTEELESASAILDKLHHQEIADNLILEGE